MTDQNNAAQPGLTDDEIESLALKHIAPHYMRFLGKNTPYRQTEQFCRVKALIGDVLSKLRAEGVQAGDPRDVLSDTGHKEADRLIGRLTSADPDFDDCTDAAALLRRLVLEEIKGPDGYATWKDAAIAERLARAAARPTNAIVAMAREGLEVYSGPNMNEHKVCAELVRLADTSRAALASAPVAAPIQWPTMPPSKGQSPVLFEDGYAEGWAKCMDECRRAVAQASAPVAGEPRGRQGVSVERLAKDPFLAAQLWRNPVDRAPVAGEACQTNPISSRACERGTKSCVVQHAAPQASEAVGSDQPDIETLRRVGAAHDAGIAASEDVAPWPDYAGNPIRHGDRIRHPEGLEGVVVRLPGYADAHDAWCVAYQDRTVSRLSLQIGDRGQAVVQGALSAQPGAQTTSNDGGK